MFFLKHGVVEESNSSRFILAQWLKNAKGPLYNVGVILMLSWRLRCINGNSSVSLSLEVCLSVDIYYFIYKATISRIENHNKRQITQAYIARGRFSFK